MEIIFIFPMWIATSIIIGIAAGRRFKRSEVGWAIISIFCSPLFATWWLVLLGPLPVPMATERGVVAAAP